MGSISEITTSTSSSPSPIITLRPPKPGEWGWIIQQHGEIYWNEYGYVSSFEQYVCEIVSDFMKTKKDSPRSKIWIADVDGKPMGSICCAEETEKIARLRLLVVSPEARGLGLGTRLVNECVAFAKSVGYEKVTLLTHAILTDARKLYDRAGFKLVGTSFTHFDEHRGENLELDLRTVN